MKTRILTLLALVLAAGVSSAQDAKPAKVSFETIQTRHMTVMATFNGKGPYRFIFDTGAPVTLISNKVAREAEVFPKNFKPSAFALFGNNGQFKVKELVIGDLKVANVDAMVMDHPTVAAIAGATQPIEGIIGFNVFARYRTTLDYQAKTMVFEPSTFVPANMLDRMLKLMFASKNEKERVRILAPGGLLGMRIQKDAKDEAAGVTIAEVYDDSPAQKAGLKAGDRLLTLDHRWTDSVPDCFYAASRVVPGTPVKIEVLRDGKKTELSATFSQGL